MPVKAGYLLLVGGGAVFLWSGVKGKSVSGVFRNLIGGENPAKAAEANTLLTPAAVASIENQASQGLPVASGSSKISNSQQAQAYAFSLFPKFGWGADQEQPLVNLWNQESGWNANAVNPSSQAYGIPQALPSAQGHPYSLGWPAAAAQIIWGLTYIKGRYGSPAMAWAHEQANNWY